LRTFTTTNGDKLDHLGVVASCLCAIHCALAPLTVSLIPLIGLDFLRGRQTEWVLVLISVAVGSLSFIPSYVRRHRRCSPLLIFGTGLGVILTARLWLEDALQFELPAVLVGAVLITSAHYFNLRLCRSCAVCVDDTANVNRS
jgi:uncharacterized membrane protein YfcA